MIEEAVKIEKKPSKSKTKLKVALVELLSQKKLEDITIIELTNHAQINRKTFYLHYKSINSVLKDIENNLIDKLNNALKEFNLSSNTFHDFIYISLTTIIEDELALQIFLNTSSSKNIIKIIDKICTEYMYAVLRKKYPLANKEMIAYVVEYHVYGSMRIFYNWLKEKESTMDLKAFSVFLATIINDGIDKVTENAICND